MKKRALAALALLLLLALIGAGIIAVNESMITIDQMEIMPSDQRDFMTASLTYDAGSRTLRGRQTLTAVNRTDAPLCEAVLRVCMNADEENSVAITNVCADGKSVPYETDEDDPTLLRIALDWQPEEAVELSWTLMITHKKTDGAAAITLPALARMENGAFCEETYSPLAGGILADAFDYTIQLSTAEEVKAAFGGAMTACTKEDRTAVYTAQMQSARDVSFALLDGGMIRQKMTGGVMVTALAQSGSKADDLLARAKEALGELASIGLPYPFASLSLAQGEERLMEGEAYSGLCVLSTEKEREQMRREMTRLIARQTFGVLVGNDALSEPWLSHSLASAAELLSYRKRAGERAYEARYFDEIEVSTRLTRPYGVSVGAAADRFGSEEEMTQVLRDQGGAMLMGIAEAMGTEAFLDALRLYAQDNAGSIAVQKDFEAALESISASSWHGYLQDELAF